MKREHLDLINLILKREKIIKIWERKGIDFVDFDEFDNITYKIAVESDKLKIVAKILNPDYNENKGIKK